MLEMKCPACGGTMQVEEGRLLRACPYCGAELLHETGKAAWQIPGPSDLEKRLAKEQNPKKKYKLILAELEKNPDDFGANRALLYHGRLHENVMKRGGSLDYSIIKCYLFNIFESPERYTEAELDERYAELLEGEQLQKVLSLCGDADVFFRDYIRTLSAQYIELFIRGESRNSTYAFGFRRSLDSTARLCSEGVNKMLRTIAGSARLNGREEIRALLLSAVREGYNALFPGKSAYLES